MVQKILFSDTNVPKYVISTLRNRGILTFDDDYNTYINESHIRISKSGRIHFEYILKDDNAVYYCRWYINGEVVVTNYGDVEIIDAKG